MFYTDGHQGVTLTISPADLFRTPVKMEYACVVIAMLRAHLRAFAQQNKQRFPLEQISVAGYLHADDISCVFAPKKQQR